MLRGFATVNYWADDLETAKGWYVELLGAEPYFERPGYYEFRVGDYQHELGLVDRRYAPPLRRPARAAPSCTGTSTTWRRPSSGCCPWGRRSTSRSRNGERRDSSPLRWSTLRERPGRHVQPALPGGPGREQKSVSSSPGAIAYQQRCAARTNRKKPGSSGV